MLIVGEPTMDGFAWSPAPPYVPMAPGEDGWCVRYAFCDLFRWAPGSTEWLRFEVEGPQSEDVVQLTRHLGLSSFVLPEDWDELASRPAHPGVAWFVFPAYRRAHTVYVPDTQWLLYHWAAPGGLPTMPFPGHRLYKYGWPLSDDYMMLSPELDSVIVDERQPTRLA